MHTRKVKLPGPENEDPLFQNIIVARARNAIIRENQR